MQAIIMALSMNFWKDELLLLLPLLLHVVVLVSISNRNHLATLSLSITPFKKNHSPKVKVINSKIFLRSSSSINTKSTFQVSISETDWECDIILACTLFNFTTFEKRIWMISFLLPLWIVCHFQLYTNEIYDLLSSSKFYWYKKCFQQKRRKQKNEIERQHQRISTHSSRYNNANWNRGN